MGPITVHQVSPIYRCWVHRRGDAQMKNTTRNLASSTKMSKSFANFGNKLIATHFDHGLSESCITDETIVNAQEFSLLAFLFELIRDVVLVIPRLLPETVPVGSPFLDVVIGNREEIECT